MGSLIKEWRNVVGYESLYKVSNYGEIKAKRRVIYAFIDGERQPISVSKEKQLSLVNHGNGYLYVTLVDELGKRKNHYIHRLVAEAFLPNPGNLPQVNHIDYDRKNNKVTNLEWCTAIENARHSSCNHPATHNICDSNTGYKYIYKRNDNYSGKKYRVGLKIKGKRVEKTFKTLQEAVEYRNTVAKEMEIGFKDNIN